LAASIIPLTVDYLNFSRYELDISCNISAWLVLVGIGIIFSAFYSKTRRIYKIMKSSKRCRRIQVRIQDSIIPMISLLSCTCGIFIFLLKIKKEKNSAVCLHGSIRTYDRLLSRILSSLFSFRLFGSYSILFYSILFYSISSH
jgi:hypothetical protein